MRPWPGFAAQKNFALEQATGEWVLSLDADERVTPELRERIRRDRARRTGPPTATRSRGSNVFWGAWVRHGGLYPDYQLRLFRRGAGRFVDSAVHESVVVDGAAWSTLAEPMLHHSYRGLEDFVAARTGTPRSRPRRSDAGGGAGRARSDLVTPPARAVPLHVRCCAGASSTAGAGSCWPSSTPTTCSCAWPRRGRRGGARDRRGVTRRHDAIAGARAVGDAPDGQAPPRQLPGRARQLGAAPGRVRLLLLRRELARADRPTRRTASQAPDEHDRDGGGLARAPASTRSGARSSSSRWCPSTRSSTSCSRW